MQLNVSCRRSIELGRRGGRSEGGQAGRQAGLVMKSVGRLRAPYQIADRRVRVLAH